MDTLPDEMLNLKPSEVTFVRKLKQSEYSTLFQVTVRGKECVMKVYRTRAKSDAENPLIEHNLFICESRTYRRLKERGLCDKGVVPQFFGTIEEIQPDLWKPHLNMFLEQELLPNAILIEYIPNMQMIDLPTFSTDRLNKLLDILKEIHNAKILHHDPYPRNMMIVPGNPDRVLWIDFDRAQTYSTSLTERQREWFRDENELMEEFVEGLKKDVLEGKYRNTFHYYFEGMSPNFCEENNIEEGGAGG